MTESTPARNYGWVRHAAGLCVTVLCLVVLFSQVSPHDIWNALRAFQWPYLLPGLLSLAIGYTLRIQRWAIMLRAAGAKVGLKDCAAPFLASIALNNVLPLRLGDVVRALVFPLSMGITRTAATSSLIIERLIDLMTLLISFTVGLFAIQAINLPQSLKSSALMLALIGGICLAAGFLLSGPIARYLAQEGRNDARGQAFRKIAGIGAELLSSFEAMSRVPVLLQMLVISLLIWAGEAGLFYFVLLGTGAAASFEVALLVMAVATLSTLVPSSPGYVGPFHLAAYTAIALVGGTPAQAAGYAVLVHLALWLPTTLAGAVAIWLRPELFRAARRGAPSNARQ